MGGYFEFPTKCLNSKLFFARPNVDGFVKSPSYRSAQNVTSNVKNPDPPVAEFAGDARR